MSWKRWFAPVLGLALIGGIAVWYFSAVNDRAQPVAAPATLATLPVPSPTPTPTPTPSAEATCEGPDTVFNIEGEPVTSLLPDCGSEPVTVEQQRDTGLGLGCGGDYPSILFKTNTGATRVSVCGTNAVGDHFRVVVRERGGDVQDLPGSYVWERDAFVGTAAGVRYEIRGYDGSVHITRDGTTTVQTSDDWMSLANEPEDG